MAWCPFATHVTDIALRASQRPIKPVGLVCHTAVSNSKLLRPTGTVRWHFYLAKDGKLFQFFSTTVSASCQHDGNRWTVNGQGRGFLSCESWDGAGVVWDGRNVNALPPWNDSQLRTWARLGAWLHDAHGIPLVRATGVHGEGIGYHAQFTASEDSGRLKWNTSHACPARARIAQMPTVIRMMNDAAKGEEDDMFSEADRDKLEFLYGNLGRITSLRDGKPHAAGWFLATGAKDAFDVKKIIQEKVLPALTAEQQRDAAEALVLTSLQSAVAQLRGELDGDLSDSDVHKLSQLLLVGLVGDVTPPEPTPQPEA